MRALIEKFWAWYERNRKLNIGLAAGLFLLQLIHLYWLTAHVVTHRIFSIGYFEVSDFVQFLIIIVDYTEIPALLGVSLIYLNELRQRFNWPSVIFLLFLNSQWLHIFWITDEFVISQFAGRASTVLPALLAWSAILIDYLELPVIVDTIKRFFKEITHPRQP